MTAFLIDLPAGGFRPFAEETWRILLKKFYRPSL